VSNSSNLERFILNHFRKGTHFKKDAWAGYNFLNKNIKYTDETHVHGGGDFGYSLHSTSYIEGLLEEIKKLMMKIYGIIPMNNFVYYLKEIEMLILIKNSNDTKKMETFKNMMKIVYYKCKFKFSSKNEIEE
jgi:hypothetical protein